MGNHTIDIRVMFDRSRPNTVIGNRVAAEAGLRSSGRGKLISSEDGEAEYSSCE